MLKHVLSSVAVLTVASGFTLSVGCAGEPATRPTTQTAAAPTTKPVNTMCAVENDDPIDPNVTTVYNGKVVAFCCKDCVPKFKQDPEKYMKNLK